MFLLLPLLRVPCLSRSLQTRLLLLPIYILIGSSSSFPVASSSSPSHSVFSARLADFHARNLHLSMEYVDLAKWFVSCNIGVSFLDFVSSSFPHLVPDLARDFSSGSSRLLSALHTPSLPVSLPSRTPLLSATFVFSSFGSSFLCSISRILYVCSNSVFRLRILLLSFLLRLRLLLWLPLLFRLVLLLLLPLLRLLCLLSLVFTRVLVPRLYRVRV